MSKNAVAPGALVQRYHLAIVVPLTSAAVSSVIHDVDLCELFGGGETHAYTVLKLAALARPPNVARFFNPTSPLFQILLHVFVGLSFDEKRAQSLPSSVIGGVLCLSGKNIQTRPLRNEWITKLGVIGLRSQ